MSHPVDNIGRIDDRLGTPELCNSTFAIDELPEYTRMCFLVPGL